MLQSRRNTRTLYSRAWLGLGQWEWIILTQMRLPAIAVFLGVILSLAGLLPPQTALAQTTGATFGEVIALGGTPSDIVLDEARGRLYLVNSNADRVDIYSYVDRAVIGSIPVGRSPMSAAMSPDHALLYVTNNLGASLTVIDLASGNVLQTVSLPARPEGVEVGADGRVLIATQGTGTGNLANTLLIYDRNQSVSQQVTAVQFAPPPPMPPSLPPIYLPRPVSRMSARLCSTPDRQFIVGLVNYSQNSQMLFVYEAASGTLLRSRSVSGQSTVLSMAPDGSRFMAGFTLYNTATLAVMAQQNTANSPFPISGSFNTNQNIGGSSFAPDGKLIYSAFNVAATSLPPPRPQSSTLLISDSVHLGIRLGIKMPESVIGRMVITSDGANAWGLSESGLVYLALSTLYEHPILQPETTQVFLAIDPCNPGIARASLRVNNLGKGKLTFSVPPTGNALVAQTSSGVVPSTITFTMEPGRFNVSRQPGTNLYSGNNGYAVNINLISPEAINIPNTIRVYMNYRQPDQRGVLFPVPTTLDNSQGLQDLLLDEPRGLLYLTNAGYNRIEVFDLKKQKYLEPIEVGQLPRQMAITLDGNTMYVANGGGESISIVDLESRTVVGDVEFPPIPRNASGLIYPRSLAMSLSGLQIIMSNGTLWELVGNQAVPRPENLAIFPTRSVSSPAQMVATPNGEYILMLDGRGIAYLYDALVDEYTASRQIYTPNQQIISYFGPLGAAPKGAFYLANGLILSPSIAVIGGAERPGQVQYGPSPGPGLPPTQTIVSAGQRHVASLAPIDESTFVRMTLPVRQSVTSPTRDDVRPTLELVDIRTGAESLVGVAAEQPPVSVFGMSRVNIPPRQLVVDSAGNAYAITISGLSFIPLAQSGTSNRPQIRGGSRGIVNATDGTPNFKPGSFIAITGSNLALPAAADQIPPPSVLGGSCVTFSDVPLNLIETAPGQILAQVPENIRPGMHVAQVRSLANAQKSDPVVVTVQRP